MTKVSDRVDAPAEEHVGALQRAASLARIAARPALGVASGILLIVALLATGAIAGSNGALEQMGFDPDRAELITGLTVGGLAAGLGTLLTGRRAGPIAVAYLGLAAVFGRAFLDETANAVATGGPDGFRPLGWLATVVTLGAAGLVTGWTLAMLALEIRRWLLAGLALLVELRRGTPRPETRGDRRRLFRTLAPILAVAVVAGSIPTFSDMINYTPDVAMTGGAILQAPPLVGGPSGSAPLESGPALASGSPRTGVLPASGGANPGSAGGVPASAPAAGGTGGAPAGLVTPGALATTEPWRVSVPTGQGHIVSFTLPSPWTGRSPLSTVWIYLPPGYGDGGHRYPVIYTVPWDLTHWAMGIHVTSLLDQAITSGELPPSIVAFVNLAGGPFPTSECANSYDGREHADTYVSATVVRAVDSRFRTIPDPRARTIAGFSQGGFCAANLLLRHPDVFRQAVIFSGYFVAGLRSGETVNAWMPFGRVPALIAANSPLQTAGRLPPAVRSQLFVVLSAQPDIGVFGQQAVQFASVLTRDGYPTDFLWNQFGHAWKAVRLEFIPALHAVAEREVETGVLG
ncbi:MAG: alpha/beta hydrolase [Candidatus Limnocylindrales bacterium]